MDSMKSDARKSVRVRQHDGLRFALAAVVLAMGAECAHAQCVDEQRLTPSDGLDGRDLFGGSVSVSGATAFVGRVAAAHVFRLNGTSWVEAQKLTASDAAQGGGSGFGNAVSISGNTAVVGARADDCAGPFSTCGAAYVFRFNGTSWVEEQKLTATDAAMGDQFGGSVSVDGDTVVVGAVFDSCAVGELCGSAYVYRYNGASWVEEQKLSASDARGGDGFGLHVSVSEDTIVVGAAGRDCAAGVHCGAAYVFQFNGHSWVEVQKLAASDALGTDQFGASVSVNRETVVVGASTKNCALGVACGAAYVFRFNGDSWVESWKLTASDAAAGDRFGASVSVDGNTALVGADSDACFTTDFCGAAYVYQRKGTSWLEVQKLTASDARGFAVFGTSVSVNGATALVGAHGDACPTGPTCGAAYVFSCVSPVTAVGLDIKPGGCPNPVNPKSKGVVPVAIVGSVDFDVATIDLGSLTLGRADGVGESVSPLSGRRGSGIAIDDVATPFDGEPCACHKLRGDGIDDLTLTFSTSEMSRALDLNESPKGETIELVLRGRLQDGTMFEATDCIVMPGSRRTSSELRRTGRSK